jgi:hypothetical protein
MTFNHILQALWVVVIVMNGLTALAALASGFGRKARKHLLFAASGVVMLLLVRSCGKIEAERAAKTEPAPTTSAATSAEPPPSEAPTTATPPAMTAKGTPIPPPKAATRVAPADAGHEAAKKTKATPPLSEALIEFFDVLLYVILTVSPVLSIGAGLLFFLVRRRAIRSGRAPREKWVYLVTMVGGMAVWLWHGFRPTPSVFRERFGLFWGWKKHNVEASLYSAYPLDQRIAYKGKVSLKIDFGKERGWVILHHFPMPPMAKRYEKLEFYVRRTDLSHDDLVVWLFGDGKKQYPSADGIVVGAEHVSAPSEPKAGWERVVMDIADFALPTRGIIGIGIGKAEGEDQGSLYLDEIRLLEKGKR